MKDDKAKSVFLRMGLHPGDLAVGGRQHVLAHIFVCVTTCCCFGMLLLIG